ncbi:MAG: DUF4911 domain-containing protein [Candidatus Cloacimonetes bacterium]|nr:DUF4911 domain-containing protein [Candidatus Cloacimonadota bacterium]MCF7814191.1 DUF4911 domain-containing protein [Candidatus Cloacimonadota bacterium]MCF7868860.1 DUF4911 domain-containing protein [Candidatus Cloacimonadota bacterium]MCF7884247.1 DUF4911 domain-containing protein [Candidatus Cloacimonadota bacterium]
MNIKIIDQHKLSDGCTRINIGVSDKERIYLGFILESFEGWSNYTTPVRKKPVLQVDVVPDFLEDFWQLYRFLEKWQIK